MYKCIKNFFDNDLTFPPNERLWLFCMLILSNGILGGFTFSLKGRLFVNAQTGNMILFSTGLGTLDKVIIKNTLTLLVIYFIAVMLAEYFSKKLYRQNKYIWEKILLLLSIITTFIIGFIPETTAFEFSLYPIAFIAAMQFATFERAHGLGMATGFCTNHLKQTATNLTRFLRTNDKTKLINSLSHFSMIFCFISGSTLAVALGNIFLGKTIWLATALFLIIYIFFSISIENYNKNKS